MNLKSAELSLKDIRVGKKVFWYCIYDGKLITDNEYVVTEVDIKEREVTLESVGNINRPKGVGSYVEFLEEYYCSRIVRENFPEMFI